MKVILPLFPIFMRPCLEDCIQLRIIRRLEHISYKERLQEVGLFSLEKAPGVIYSSLSVFSGDLLERLQVTLYHELET